MNLSQMHYVWIDEEGRLQGSIPKLFDGEDELAAAKEILEALRGFRIVRATAILKSCENVLQQAAFLEEINF